MQEDKQLHRQPGPTSNFLVTKTGKVALDADSISNSTITLILNTAVAAIPLCDYPFRLYLDPQLCIPCIKHQPQILNNVPPHLYPSHLNLSESRLG